MDSILDNILPTVKEKSIFDSKKKKMTYLPTHSEIDR